MADDQQGDKTEEPTQKRRQDARRKGNVARSMDLTAAALMTAAASVMFFMGGGIFQSCMELLSHQLAGPSFLTISNGLAIQQFWGIAQWGAWTVLPLMVTMMLVAILINVSQVGFLAATESLQPKFNRLNPIEGAKRILSLTGLVKLAVNIGKIVVLVSVAGYFIYSELPSLIQMAGSEPPIVVARIGRAIVELAFLLALALICLALLDFAYQRWKYEQDLKMTKQEVRDEMKNMEGDPHIRQRRKEAHRKLAQARELQQVPDADVVVTNPTHIAVALKYDPEKMPAPTVVAKGMGEIAGRIRQIAAQHGVPILERKELARALYRDVKVGQVIPVDLYEVFVEIMAYVYRLTGRAPKDAA